MKNQPNTPTVSNQVIKFARPDGPNGWMTLHAPYGFKYLGETWNSAAQAWLSIVHSVNHVAYAKGHYKTSDPNFDDIGKYGHLVGILKAKVAAHPILADYLLETKNSSLVYTISKFSSQDKKFLGLFEDEGIGRNKLGKAWMEIRDQLQKQKQCPQTPTS